MFRIAHFYHFVSLPDYEDMQEPILECCRSLALKGTVLIADEGINGTIAGNEETVESFINFLSLDEHFKGIQIQNHNSTFIPFDKMKVRLKNELVGLKIPDNALGGEVNTVMLDPQEWHQVICDGVIPVLDLRNSYETGIGKFKGAITADLTNFRDFPNWLADWSASNTADSVAMYCTGGIRCEKIVHYMGNVGFKTVYQLQGGIINYLRQFQHRPSAWEGDCFVFDNRVAIDSDCVPTGDIHCTFCQKKVAAEEPRWASKKSISCESCRVEATLCSENPS